MPCLCIVSCSIHHGFFILRLTYQNELKITGSNPTTCQWKDYSLYALLDSKCIQGISIKYFCPKSYHILTLFWMLHTMYKTTTSPIIPHKVEIRNNALGTLAVQDKCTLIRIHQGNMRVGGRHIRGAAPAVVISIDSFDWYWCSIYILRNAGGNQNYSCRMVVSKIRFLWHTSSRNSASEQ